MNNYYNAVACSSSNHSLPPMSTLAQYSHQNYIMPYCTNQQSWNYDEAQTNALLQYGEGLTEPAAVAVVHTLTHTRSVIAINEDDGTPQLVDHQAAFLSYNDAQDPIAAQYGEKTTASVAAAVERSIATIQSEIAMNSVDFNCNYQNNNEYNDAITQYNENEIMSTAIAALQPITTKEPRTPINPDDFPGELNFQFFINSDESYTKSFVYSKQLGKVFLSMKKVLPVQFSWQNCSLNLRVRACMIFQDGHSRDKPVQRCNAHKASELPENSSVEPVQLKFTFRTKQRGSFYQEDANNGFLSIVTPAGLPNPGRDYFQVDYQFFCMTSCVTGINRRATSLVFTLESENGFIFGRRSLPIQICSCPKRDSEKEEKSVVNPFGKKKKLSKNKKVEKPAPYQVSRPQFISKSPQPASNFPQPTINLPKSMSTLPNNEEEEALDLHLKIVGGEHYLEILNFAYSRMLKDAFENDTFDKYREALDDIKQKIKEYERATSSSQ